MLKKTQIILNFINVKSIIFLFSCLILQVNAETKIIAKNGDTLFKLSKQYGIPLKELMHKNNFNDANRILEGEVILIPLKDTSNHKNKLTYKVIKGDTLYKIARDHNVEVTDIMTINNFNNTPILIPNQIILLPNVAGNKKIINQRDIQLASKEVFYHQTSNGEEIEDIAKIHKVKKSTILTLNKLNTQIKINPNTKLKIRENKSLKWLKYGPIMINWSDWRYLDGNYITQAKNKKNKSFYIAISCERRVLNNSLKNSYWENWYFPSSDFEFKLINDFCDQDFKI
jgi:LysM repeat protein